MSRSASLEAERRQTSAGVQHVFHVDGTDGPVADVTYDGTTTSPGYVVSDPLGSTAVVRIAKALSDAAKLMGEDTPRFLP